MINRRIFVRDAANLYKDWLLFRPNFNDRKLVYIAGPMTGIKDDNRAAFNRAAEKLIRMGYTPVNPVDIDVKVTQAVGTHNNRSRTLRYENPLAKNIEELIELPVPVAIKKAVDFAILPICTHFVMLPGWENSSGARAELSAAIEMELEQLDLPKK